MYNTPCRSHVTLHIDITNSQCPLTFKYAYWNSCLYIHIFKFIHFESYLHSQLSIHIHPHISRYVLSLPIHNTYWDSQFSIACTLLAFHWHHYHVWACIPTHSLLHHSRQIHHHTYTYKPVLLLLFCFPSSPLPSYIHILTLTNPRIPLNTHYATTIINL